MFYYTYVLRCTKNGVIYFYVGYTTDLRKRVKRHLQKEVEATRSYERIELVYYEACQNKTDARKRELQLKTGFGKGYIKRRLVSYLQSAGVVQQ